MQRNVCVVNHCDFEVACAREPTNIPTKVRNRQERAKDEHPAGVQGPGVIENPSHHQGQGQQDALSQGRPIMGTPGAAFFHHLGHPKLQRDLTTLNVLNCFLQNIPKVRPESSGRYRIHVIRYDQTWSEGKREETKPPGPPGVSGMIVEELRSVLIWKPGQQIYSLLRFRNDAETGDMIPSQFNGTTDDSFLGICGTERIAVIAGTWQRNQASASSPLGCIPWGPPVQRLGSLS